MTRVCDSCMTVAYDKGINGAAEQAATMVSIGAELSDHICDEFEPDGEIRCDCGCHGRAKRLGECSSCGDRFPAVTDERDRTNVLVPDRYKGDNAPNHGTIGEPMCGGSGKALS